MPLSAQPERISKSPPFPEEGLRIVDPAWPSAVWKVVQADLEAGDGVVYIEREQDGLLYHHTRAGWDRAWTNGFLLEASHVAS